MGAKLSVGDKIEPREFNNIRNLYGRSDSDTSDDFRMKNRSTTDICFLLFMTTFFTIFLCFLAYCVFYGDIFRILNGYDNCGNVCGRLNIPTTMIKDQECLDSSRTSQLYHIVMRKNHSKIKERKCVSSCLDYEGYRSFFYRCIPIKTQKFVNTYFSKTGLSNFFQEVSEDIDFCWKEFIYLCLISLGFSGLIVILFRFLVGVFVWVVLIGVVLACSIGTVLLWIMWDQNKKSLSQYLNSDVDVRKEWALFVFAILATIIAIVVILVIFVMRKRIQLVIALFKEAGKAITAIPFLLLQPILTCISLIITVVLWLYFSLWIESCGYLTEKYPKVYYYEKNFWMRFTRWYNFLALLWMLQFIIGCQHMIVAGAVVDWYFKRNKKSLILKSSYSLLRYHLGSVALGSFLISTTQFLRVLLKIVEKYLNNHEGKYINYFLKCCHCCLFCFENVLKYINRNAYIEIAMYGHNFCTASRRAFKLLVTNALRVATINSVGDFVLFLGKILVVIATVLTGIKLLKEKDGVQHMWVPVTLAGLFAYFVAHCFVTIYEMVIDTIFLCFCEDCEQNDGISKPYFMSRGLMEFVENSKKVLEIDDSRQAWPNKCIPTVSESVKSKFGP